MSHLGVDEPATRHPGWTRAALDSSGGMCSAHELRSAGSRPRRRDRDDAGFERWLARQTERWDPVMAFLGTTRWSSYKDLAAKALRKLAGPHVPASLTKLEQAVKRAHTAYEKAERAQREHQHAAPVKDLEAT